MLVMFLDHVNEFHRHAYHVLTDGSKDPNGVRSAAVSDSSNILRKLCPLASIFTAELQAIADALIIIDYSNQDDFVIFSLIVLVTSYRTMQQQPTYCDGNYIEACTTIYQT